MNQFLKNNFHGGLPGFLMALMVAFMLAACGGGGGNPGIDPNKPPVVPVVPDPIDVAVAKAATLVITSSAPTMVPVGGSVDVSFLVRDANNNVVPGARVTVAVSSGTLSRTNVDRITDKDGLIKETLTTPGDATEREITITGLVGKIAATPLKVKVAALRPTLVLSSSSGVLDSAGSAGTEVTITALVRDSGNNVLANVPVTLTADSGALSQGTRITDAKGVVKETLSIGGDKTSRVINVSASIPSATAEPLKIQVAGHKISISANDSANLGKPTSLTAQLVDSLGSPMVGVPISFVVERPASKLYLAGKNESTGKSPSVTDSQGQIQLEYVPGVATAANIRTDQITVSALGVTATKSVLVNTIEFTVGAFNANSEAIVQANTSKDASDATNCILFKATVKDNGTAKAGTVTMNSSRGTVHADASCSPASVLSTPIALNSLGEAIAFVKSTTPGIASLVANYVGGGITASSSGQLEFVAPVVATARIDLQADPAVVSAGKATTLKAVVRDGTALDNLVKNATVVFSIVSDSSGGKLAQPTVVKTDASGAAFVTYTAGPTSTALGGVILQAKIEDSLVTTAPNKNPAQTAITVSGQSLFISAGTGNSVGIPSSTTYSVDYTVFVTDASGNAVNNAVVVASVLPNTYYKGYYLFNSVSKLWTRFLTTTLGCANEDKNQNGILDFGEDANGNNRLEPGIPITVTTSGTTDATGQTKVTLTYPKDRANWLSVDMTIRARVAGTEAKYVTFTLLPGAGVDFNNEGTAPPGSPSPFGSSNFCTDDK